MRLLRCARNDFFVFRSVWCVLRCENLIIDNYFGGFVGGLGKGIGAVRVLLPVEL